MAELVNERLTGWRMCLWLWVGRMNVQDRREEERGINLTWPNKSCHSMSTLSTVIYHVLFCLNSEMIESTKCRLNIQQKVGTVMRDTSLWKQISLYYPQLIILPFSCTCAPYNLICVIYRRTQHYRTFYSTGGALICSLRCAWFNFAGTVE